MTPRVLVGAAGAVAVLLLAGFALAEVVAAPGPRARLLAMLGTAAVLLLAGLGLVGVVSQLRLWAMRRDIRRLHEAAAPERAAGRARRGRPTPR